MTYPKEVIEEAEKLVEAHKTEALFYLKPRILGSIVDEISIKSALVSCDIALKTSVISREHWQQVKEYLENKLKQL